MRTAFATVARSFPVRTATSYLRHMEFVQQTVKRARFFNGI